MTQDPRTCTNLGMIAHTCKYQICWAEAVGSGVQGQLLLTEFEDNLGYRRLYLRKTKPNKHQKNPSPNQPFSQPTKQQKYK